MLCISQPWYVTCGSDGRPPLITIWKLLVAPPSLIAIPFKGYVQDYSMSVD